MPTPPPKKPASHRIFNFCLAVLALTTACVTVNVNLPEAAVQNATDDYVREIYRAKEKGKAPTPSASPTTSLWPRLQLVTEAYADDATVHVHSAKSVAIQQRLAGRVDEIVGLKRQGVLGESNDGKLVIHDAAKLAPLLKKKTETMVAEDNADRVDLYGEILKSNNLDKGRLNTIEHSFARSFQAESPSGTWVQGQDGKWAQKP